VWGTARLRQMVEAPLDGPLEAEVLLRHAAGLSREELFARPGAPLPPDAEAVYASLIARRAAGIPVAYLVGHREFFGIDFMVDARVMIPRPETERLVEVVGAALRDHPSPRVVDIGTGSGAIAIAVARLLPRARVFATDVSAAALEVARINAAQGGVAERLEWAEGSALVPLRFWGLEGRVDALVANPPYIPTAELTNLPRDVRDAEPAVALDGGPDGLSVHRPIIAEAGHYLAAGGVLALEVSAVWNQARTIAELVDRTGQFAPACIVHDYAGVERVVIALKVGGDGDHRG